MTDENKRVDESWKKRIEQEKDKVADQPEEGEPQELPPSFAALVSSLGMQAMMHLGLVEDPMTRQAHIDPYHAQYVIDLLSVLEEKTKNNLTPEEDELIKSTLGELRMIFVKVMDAVKQAQLKQAAKGGTPPAPGGTIIQP